MEFLAHQVARLLDTKVDHVAQIGQVITPAIPAQGRGRRSLYSFQNCIEIALYEVLNKFGVPRKFIKGHIENLRQSKFHWLDEGGESGWVVLDNSWRWSAGPTPDSCLVTLRQSYASMGIIAVDVGSMKVSLRQRIEKGLHLQ